MRGRKDLLCVVQELLPKCDVVELLLTLSVFKPSDAIVLMQHVYNASTDICVTVSSLRRGRPEESWSTSSMSEPLSAQCQLRAEC